MLKLKGKYEFLIGSMRVLTLLSAFENNRSYQMTFDKLILLDFYMRFPQTMLNLDVKNFDFEELYSFYHSYPDREYYQKILRILISKRIIEKEIFSSSFVYRINPIGLEIVKGIKNEYSTQMYLNALLIKKTISKLSEAKIREEISNKSLNNIHLIS
ncbi:ABC-three component system middle component 2 [uncultured Flavobacterium sp.]|uniref:ABC-three component system middle component 2 n=1 Tax=uncultured Flavobacterium sp. TaxID=165435 RepID=UPI0030EB9FE2|tara:strand:+ start:29343 stop:29813 length:471 start_codon:yes stop_codon:yes gene_type:complete